MYTSNINIIGSIPDYNLIIDSIGNFAKEKSKKEIQEKIFDQNIYNIRTKKSRSRFLKAINSVFIQFKSDNHRTIYLSLFRQEQFLSLKKKAIFFQFAINDNLFFELSKNIFLPLYMSGRLTVDISEFSSYLYDLRDKNKDINNWSDSTIKIVASKYLTIMKKLNFIEGRAKKEFKNITPDDAAIVYFLYLIKSLDNHGTNMMKNPYISLLMINKKNLIDRIKKISIKDYFSITTVGDDLRLDLKYSFKDVVDAIIKEHESKI
jgi:hypothetical protein